MKEIQANTFTPLYDEIEDRLRLVINYKDIQNRVDLMITRAFIINLLPASDEFMMKHFIEEQNNLDNIQSKEDNLSKTDPVNLELYQTDEELLREVNFAYDAKSKVTVLKFSTKETTAKATLSQDMLKQVLETLKSAIPNFKWGIAHNF